MPGVSIKMGAYFPTPVRYYYEKVQQPSQQFNLQIAGITTISYVNDTAGTAESGTPDPDWYVDATPPFELELQTDGLAFQNGTGQKYFSRDGAVFTGWHGGTGLTDQIGTANPDGKIIFTDNPMPASYSNLLTWSNIAHNRAGALDILNGVFRVNVAPIKAGSFQLQEGAVIGNANSGGILSGGFIGLVDFQRGIVRWGVSGLGDAAAAGAPVQADQVTYNAVYLSYVPLDKTLLGVDPVRLPLDGKVPIYRSGGPVVVHNTQTLVLPNPLTKGFQYNLGRQRIAVIPRVLDASGATVDPLLYDADLDAGLFWVKVGANLAGLVEPFSVQHRIEDIMQVAEADISGRLKFTRALSHLFPLGSYVSSIIAKGDLFGRVENYFEQESWTNVWSDARIGNATTSQFNNTLYPIVTTNRGAIDERWAIIFTSNTAYKVVGESVGEIATGTVNADLVVNNPGALVPYMTINRLAFGGGWAQGNVIRFNTKTCGGPIWVAKATLQGPNTLQSDVFELSWRGNVDAQPV